MTASGSGELWAANVSGLHGWIRLFLNIPDPAQLRNPRTAGPAGADLAAHRDGATTSRYGQLAYTSFDAVGTVGGWQVKETSGGLTPAETQALIAGVRTVFRPVGEMPDFPTPEQLEHGPRRLAYRHLGDGAGYWHTFPAGSDSTGRPGNVFAHVLLDRAPDTHPRYRAIQRWRSSHWLQPFGAAAVARAALPGTLPELGNAVTKDSVVAFALDAVTWRLATLFALLDAVAAALAGGPPVVLGCGPRMRRRSGSAW